MFNVSSMVRIVVQDSNTPPTLQVTNCTIAENVAGPYTICKLNATDAEGDEIDYRLSAGSSNFQLSTSGCLSLVSGKSLNYESQSTYSVQVVVSDVVKYPQSTESRVNVFVLDRNDPPIIFSSTFSIFENQARGTLQGSTAMIFTDEDKDGLLCSSFGVELSSFLIHESHVVFDYRRHGITLDLLNEGPQSLLIEERLLPFFNGLFWSGIFLKFEF